MKLNHIVAAAAFVAAGAANAAINTMDGGAVAGNSSALLVMMDSTTGTAGPLTRGLTIDLGFSFNDFLPTGSMNAADQQITWDFANNTVTKTIRSTGATTVLSGPTDNDWSTQVADFVSKSNPAQVKFALVAGSIQGGTTPLAFVATGAPTATQLGQQGAAETANMYVVDSLFTANSAQGTHATATNGAYSMALTDPASVSTNYHAATTGRGWKNQLTWNGWGTPNTVGTNVYKVVNDGSEEVLADTALYEGGASAYDITGLLNGLGTLSMTADLQALRWTTAASAVPEPSTYAMTLLGLVGVAALARRRRA